MSSLLVVQDESASLSPEQAVAYTQLKSEKVFSNYNNSAIVLSFALANKATVSFSLSIFSLYVAGRSLGRLVGWGDWSKSTIAKMHGLLYFFFSLCAKHRFQYLWLFPLVSYFRIVHGSVNFAGSGFGLGKGKGKTSSSFLLYT
jgi:hypothetical protein